MSNLELREKALTLRKKEFSYSQIKSELGVSKSTLSYWLKDYPLSHKRIDELRNKNAKRIERFRQSMFEKRKKRLDQIYTQAKSTILPLTKKELLLAGLCLYWGEGTKSDWSKIALTNSDPNVLRFFIHWLKRACNIDKKDLKIRLQLYCDMNIKKEILFWSKILSIPLRQFRKSYIKSTCSKRINHKGGFGHGTCAVMFNRVILKEKIMMQMKVLADLAQKTRL